MLVVATQLAFAQDASLPRLNLRHDERQQPQSVIRRQNGHAQHVAENADHEERLHRGADLERMLGDFVAGEAVEELAQRPPPPTRRRAIVALAMTELVAVVAVAIVACFAAGTIFNVRLGRDLMRWMQDGLPMLGQRTTVRWLGSTAIELVIQDARPPFTSATLVIFLEPRDLPWMWALGRSRGRRDTLILRGALRRAPVVGIEALDPGSWSGRDARGRVPREWSVRPVASQDGIVVHHADAASLARADGLLALAKRSGLIVRRLSVRSTDPNLQLHVQLPDRRRSARELFEALHAIAELAPA